jgi:GT2 family glycosyltransferase
MTQPTHTPFDVSVVILNYNGKVWLEKCISSLAAQTILSRIQVIIADNASPDGSARLAEDLLIGFPNAIFVQNGGNFGFCEGNNLGAKHATGRFLFFLNNDTWLEPDCMEILLSKADQAGVTAANPLVMDYGTNDFQLIGGGGFDMFGIPNALPESKVDREIFSPCGCSYLIDREMFWKVGGFDPAIFMYSDEIDLSWRVRLAGGRIMAFPGARMHHRGSASVNPAGGAAVVEFRTSETKRYFTNRNGLFVLLKNSQNFFLLFAMLNFSLLLVELMAAAVLIRRWSFLKKSYFQAFKDLWGLRAHIRSERKKIKGYSRVGDLHFLKFISVKPSRWYEISKLLKEGVPKVSKQ